MAISEESEIAVVVNGQRKQVLREVANGPDGNLLFMVRNVWRQKSARLGCGSEQCGACTILIDGRPARSCQRSLEGAAEITTIEGLADGAGPPAVAATYRAVAAAVRADNAFQCGYCLSGILVTAAHWLADYVSREATRPSRTALSEALVGHLCRCGAQPRLLHALLRAYDALTNDDETRPPALAEDARPVVDQTAAPGQLPPMLTANPKLDQWVRFEADQTVSVFTGRVELGQGVSTALALIAAHELGLATRQVQVQPADTRDSPEEGVTAGSMSIEAGGAAVRQAMAQARYLLRAQAAGRLECTAAEVQISGGQMSVAGRTGANQTVSFWELMAGRRFDHAMVEPVPERRRRVQNGLAPVAERVDGWAQTTGQQRFVHDLPADLHARVVRHPDGWQLSPQQVADGLAEMNLPPTVSWVVDNRFMAILGPNEARVERARRQAERWFTPPAGRRAEVIEQIGTGATLKSRETAALLLDAGGTPVDAPPGSPSSLRRQVSGDVVGASYSRGFLLHASIGPSAAAAHFGPDGLTVWSHSQGIGVLRANLAHVMALPMAAVRVIHQPGAGCYGHNGADDVALDAALAARAVPGQRVLLKWTRGDEHGLEPTGSAMLVDIEATLASGRVASWSHDVWSYTHVQRPRPPRGEDAPVALLAAQEMARPFPAPVPQPSRGAHVGIHRNAVPLYDFAKQRVVKHFCAPAPVRTSALRSLGAHANVFAIESMMDELAARARQDPLQFRLQHVVDRRARTVLEAVVELAGGLAAPAATSARAAVGRGLGFARYKNRQAYAAVVLEVVVDEQTAGIQVQRGWIAADVGHPVDADGVVNQLEGGVVQAISWSLLEELDAAAGRSLCRDWDVYPILRFPEVPMLETRLIDSHARSLGAGEAVQGPAAAALANAVCAATGLRVRDLPMTPARLRQVAAS